MKTVLRVLVYLVFFTGVGCVTAQSKSGQEQYTLDNKWEHARPRLQALEDMSNPYTIGELQALGVQKGWQVLDAGAGLGGISRWLSAAVGPSGHVDALDMEPHFLSELNIANISVVQQDLVKDDLPEGKYDFIFARDLLMHIPEREQVIGKFFRALKPGGVLMVEDLGSLPGDIRYAGFSSDQGLSDMASRVYQMLEKKGHMSFAAGYLSPVAMGKTGFINVKASSYNPYRQGGSIEGTVMNLSMLQLKPIFMKNGFDEVVYDQVMENYLNPKAHWWGMSRVTTVAVKP